MTVATARRPTHFIHLRGSKMSSQPARIEREKPDRGPVKTVTVLDPNAERLIPHVEQEHVDPERRRPVRNSHADAVGRHRAADIEERQREDGRAQGHPVRTPAERDGGRIRIVVRRSSVHHSFLRADSARSSPRGGKSIVSTQSAEAGHAMTGSSGPAEAGRGRVCGR